MALTGASQACILVVLGVRMAPSNAELGGSVCGICVRHQWLFLLLGAETC